MLTTYSASASGACRQSISPSDLQILSYEAALGARRLLRGFCLPQHDLDDIRHELLVDLLARFTSFSPERGTLGAFAGKIVKHRSARLASRIRRERKIFTSLDEPLSETDAHDRMSLAVLDLHCLAVSAGHYQPVEKRIDLRRALSGLPRREFNLCNALIDATPTEIGRTARRSRAGIYRSIQKIRAHMISNGITTAA